MLIEYLMPLKIRCPHCQKVLRAEDDTLGEERRCPACSQTFTVPLPQRVAEERAAVEVGVACPRCAKRLAPGATLCRHCATDLATGRRATLAQRWRLLSIQTRLMLGGAALLLIMAVPVIIQTALTSRRQARSEPTAAATKPAPLVPIEPIVARLFADDAGAQAAADELAAVGPRAAPALAAAMKERLAQAATRPARLTGVSLAIEVLARMGPQAGSDAIVALEACDSVPSLRQSALEARGAAKDERVAAELERVWIDRQQRRIFLERLERLTGSDAARLAQRAARESCERATRALRPLVLDDSLTALDAVVAAYWEAAGWLGNDQGEAFAMAVFELARPPLSVASASGMTFGDESRAELQSARRSLVRVAERAPAATRAAAGLILLVAAPQQKSARERIVQSLIGLLPDCPPADQQRVAWAVVRLSGRSFGDIGAATSLSHVRHEDVRAVLRWAESSGLAKPGPLRSGARSYPPPLRLERRIVPSRRLLEADLLAQLQDWTTLDAALTRWHSERLGFTPRLVELLDPRQRDPNPPALTAAMTLSPESDDPRVRRMLELWADATDQPAWVAALAKTALAAGDFRRGSRDVAWPDGLQLDLQMLAEGRPGYDHFARAVVAGGEAMIKRLKADTSLPIELRRQLLSAVEHDVRRREFGNP
ncbi:hypothetical protein RAS1_39490 [Phycisphaerae bacterium RAS1]|nr:hypothetical protein RAS1_39490 [Phycisphaerae bacterium RAS1]